MMMTVKSFIPRGYVGSLISGSLRANLMKLSIRCLCDKVESSVTSNADLTISLIERSFASEEEKYQTALSRILETYYSLDEGLRPTKLKPSDIDYMVKMKKLNGLRRFMKRLGRLESGRAEAENTRKEIKEAIINDEPFEGGIVFTETGKPVYKLHNVSAVCSYYINRRIRDWCNAKIAQSIVLGVPKVIIDFDYDQHMTAKQFVTIFAQIKFCISIRRHSASPVELHFCNLKPDSPLTKYFEMELGSYWANMIEATSSSYLDRFPKERLVYLTADTPNVLDYDPEDIYIIGGMIDAQTNEPLSALKAEREGLRTAKLPTDNYAEVKNALKSFKIGNVFGVISELASGNDMKSSLQRYLGYRMKTEEEADSSKRRQEIEFAQSRETMRRKFSLSEEEIEAMTLLSFYYIQELNDSEKAEKDRRMD